MNIEETELSDYDKVVQIPYTRYYQVWKDDKFGISYCKSGCLIVDCICDKCEVVYKRNVLVFETGGKQGVVLLYTGEVSEAIFDEVNVVDDNDALIPVRIGDEWGYITEEGGFTTDEDEAFFCTDVM